MDEALPALGDDEAVGPFYAEAAAWTRVRYCSSGRNVDRVTGALALRLGRLDEAEQHFRTGLAWIEREGVPVEQGRNLQGLAEIAERRGQLAQALQHLDRAAALFQQHGAKLYLDQVLAAKLRLQGIASGLITTSSIDAVTAAVSAQSPDLRSHAAPEGR